MLVTHLRFQLTERFFSREGDGVQMPTINECHLLHCGRAQSTVGAGPPERKLHRFARKVSGKARDGHWAAPTKKINGKDLQVLPHVG